MLCDNLVPIYHSCLKENYEDPCSYDIKSMGLQNKCNMENSIEKVEYIFSK